MEHRKSIFSQERELLEAAEAKGFAAGVNAALAWLVADGDTNRAQRMRAAFVDQSEHQEPSA